MAVVPIQVQIVILYRYLLRFVLWLFIMLEQVREVWWLFNNQRLLFRSCLLRTKNYGVVLQQFGHQRIHSLIINGLVRLRSRWGKELVAIEQGLNPLKLPLEFFFFFLATFLPLIENSSLQRDQGNGRLSCRDGLRTVHLLNLEFSVALILKFVSLTPLWFTGGLGILHR